jgi:hypothetical protein
MKKRLGWDKNDVYCFHFTRADMKNLLLVFFFGVCHMCAGQNGPEALPGWIGHLKNDSERVTALGHLSDSVKFVDSKQAISYAETALKLAKK